MTLENPENDWREYIEEVKQHPWYISFKETQSEEEINLLKQIMFDFSITIDYYHSHKEGFYHHIYINLIGDLDFYLETGSLEQIEEVARLLNKRNDIVKNIKLIKGDFLAL